MSRKLLSLVLGLAFAGSLCLSGCEPSTPSAPENKPAPASPGSKPEDKKTGAIVPSSAPTGVIAAAQGGALKEGKCSTSGCSDAALAGKTLVHAGKTVAFCGDGCLAAYKKANNIP